MSADRVVNPAAADLAPSKTKADVEGAPPLDYYTIGIGASAGGLEALKSFFDNVPAHWPHSFVIVQHLSPDYKSLMADLLAKNTEMPIQEVHDETRVEPGRIYLIPPRKNMTIEDGVLSLTDKPSGHDLNLPIDIFFRSLAEDQGGNAIAIIMSGTGSDGTRGVRAIKERGGMVMVQAPEQAKFDGMPRSAVATGLADFVLPVEELPNELLAFASDPKLLETSATKIARDNGTLQRILNHIREVAEVDFNLYKRPTIERRIARRMGITKSKRPQDYLDYLYSNPEEVHTLAREFLIGVTKFFRDARAWEVLGEHALPEIVRRNAEANTALKVWIVGCSTGEEVYSLSILLSEEIARQGVNLEVKIFATDLVQDVLDVASRGAYPESIVGDVDPSYLKKYFRKKGDNYVVRDHIRRMIIFSQHNVVVDPPLNKMDLVMCRNLLIYLRGEVQQTVLGYLHYALNLNGFMLLGSSETVGDKKAVLSTIDRQGKLYRNVESSRLRSAGLTVHPRIHSPRTTSRGSKESLSSRLSELVTDALSDEFGFAGVYVDEHFEILHAVGDIREVLALPERGFSTNLLDMLPERLSISTSAAVRRANREQKRATYRDIQIEHGGRERRFSVLAHPLSLSTAEDMRAYFILFMPQSVKPRNASSVATWTSGEGDPRVADLENELRETYSSLQSTIEEVETSNEELQATNEELLAANEELQSTNEELQSVNEELHTVNSEYQMKLKEISDLNVEMDNLLKSTEIGTIFLDREMRIRRITPAIREQFNLQDSDVGRPLSHITSLLGTEGTRQLLERAEQVLLDGDQSETEVRADGGNSYLQRVFPYLSGTDQIDGVVVSFVDITKLKEADEKLRQSEAHFRILSELAPVGIFLNDADGECVYVNPQTATNVGLTPEECLGWGWATNMTPDEKERASRAWSDAVARGGAYQNEIVFVHPNGQVVETLALAAPWKGEDGSVRGYVGVSVDLTEQKEVALELERRAEELEQFAYIASHDLQEPLRTIVNFTGLLSEQYGDQLEGTGAKSMQFISNAASRMSDLINGLLEYSRLGREREIVPVSCNEILDLVLEDLQMMITEANAEIRIGSLPEIRAAKTELRMLFQNLIGNALKFRREGVRPEIAVYAEPSVQGYRFHVRDNGIGIRPQHRERIFQIFQRLHTRQEYAGTGIGLAHCKKIVELHGGTIWAEQAGDTGALFTFEIPSAPSTAIQSIQARAESTT